MINIEIMPKKSIPKRHAIFVQEIIEQGETPEGQIKAYKIAFPNCKSLAAARSASHRLLQNVEVARLVQEGREAKKKIIEEARRKELERIAKESLISQAEVDQVLSSIIKGEFRNKFKKPIYNPQLGSFQLVAVEDPPSATEVIAAIDKYNKRFGAYAPKKIEKNKRHTVLIPGE